MDDEQVVFCKQNNLKILASSKYFPSCSIRSHLFLSRRWWCRVDRIEFVLQNIQFFFVKSNHFYLGSGHRRRRWWRRWKHCQSTARCACRCPLCTCPGRIFGWRRNTRRVALHCHPCGSSSCRILAGQSGEAVESVWAV